jgi:hypothetical protein
MKYYIVIARPSNECRTSSTIDEFPYSTSYYKCYSKKEAEDLAQDLMNSYKYITIKVKELEG